MTSFYSVSDGFGSATYSPNSPIRKSALSDKVKRSKMWTVERISLWYVHYIVCRWRITSSCSSPIGTEEEVEWQSCVWAAFFIYCKWLRLCTCL